MAKRKSVGELDTTMVLIIGAVVVGGLFLFMNKPATTTVIRTSPTGTGGSTAATTAAEIAAGATVADTLINDLTSDDNT